MNCQEINFILDSRLETELDADTTSRIEQHRASCDSCRDAWAAFNAIATKTIPETPVGLASRIAIAIAAQVPSEPRRMRQLTVIGGLLLVGAAVAASIALRTGGPTTDTAERIDEAPPTAAAESSQASIESDGAVELPTSATGADRFNDFDALGARIESGDASAVALDPYSVAVIVTPNAAASPDAIAVFEECHAYVLAELNQVAGLNVIAGERVSGFQGIDLSPDEIARALGAGVFVDLHMSSESRSCRAFAVETTTDEMIDGFGGAIPPEFPSERLRSLASNFVHRTADLILKDSNTILAEAQVKALNVALSDNERVGAILQFRMLTGTRPGVISESVKEALTQIVMTSSVATARANALVALRGIPDPDLIEHLLHALANDPDEGVRRNAAYALHNFVDQSGVRSALERARSEDHSAPPGKGCCIQTVRQAAHRSLLSDEAVIELTLETFMRETLANDSMTDRERIRLLTTSPDGRATFPFPIPDDVAHTAYEIGVRAEDSGLRTMVWAILGHAGLNAEFAETLVDDLKTHPNEELRRSAVAALAHNIDVPEVRDVVQRALSKDESAEFNRSLNSVLMGGGQ